MNGDDGNLMDLGVAAIVVVLILRMVFDFVSKRRNGTGSTPGTVGLEKIMTDKLIPAIQKLAENDIKQTLILESMARQLEKLGDRSVAGMRLTDGD